MFQRPIPAIKTLSAQELSDARFKRFLRDLDVYERKLLFERTLDGFLDLYSSWRKTKAPSLKLRLVMLVFELHRLNEEFQCDLTFKDASSCDKSSSET